MDLRFDPGPAARPPPRRTPRVAAAARTRGEISLFRRGRKKGPASRAGRHAGGRHPERGTEGDRRGSGPTSGTTRRRLPTLVLFFSDGGVYRNAEIERELREAVEEPVLWQFVGLGRANYGVLERFDTPAGPPRRQCRLLRRGRHQHRPGPGAVRPAAVRVPRPGSLPPAGRASS
ncbi:VWA domain-containing protein [Streptomyces thinghirensis]|nr:VWA domain-containing protein [Streptomyces thinghirensis]